MKSLLIQDTTKEERESLGIDYKEGEYLDKKAFAKMVDLGDEMLEIYPSSNDVQHPLLQRENTLKQLFEKGGYTNKYIKKTVYANKGYQNLPQTSPGFERL